MRSATIDILQNIFRVMKMRRIRREEPVARMKEIRITTPSL